MPAPNEMVWYKWFPAKALTSLRWSSLSVTEEGVYRRMYDLASLAQPSSRRGYFYEHDKPADIISVWKFLRIDTRTGRKCLKKFAEMQLMTQDENGAWGFPNFARHQRKGPLRVRHDGLGTAEVREQQEDIGAESGQTWGKIGTPDAEADTEAETEAEDGVITPPISDLAKLINHYCFRFPKALHAKPAKYQECREHFERAIARGITVKAMLAHMEVLQAAGNMAPTPWELFDPIDPHKRQGAHEDTREERSARDKKLQDEYEKRRKEIAEKEKHGLG